MTTDPEKRFTADPDARDATDAGTRGVADAGTRGVAVPRAAGVAAGTTDPGTRIATTPLPTRGATALGTRGAPDPGVRVAVVGGGELLARADAVGDGYAEAFGGPPWHEDAAGAARYLERLARDVRRPGFTAALALRGAEVLGFATAWTTLSPFPADRSYAQAAAALGAERTGAWLCGSREVDELVVRPAAQGAGVGAALLDAVTADAPGGRAWLLTSVRSAQAMAFYRRRGWAQVTHPCPGGNGVVVFLDPRHPARDGSGWLGAACE